MRALQVTIDSNRVTCGSCRFLRKDQEVIPRAPDHPDYMKPAVFEPHWYCDLFGYEEANLGYVSHMKTPNRPKVCTDAELVPHMGSSV